MSTMLIPQALNVDTFYAVRDSRNAAEYQLAQIPPTRIAIVVPRSRVAPGPGMELAMFWVSSMIRRMGRPFAELILVAPDEFRESESRLAKTSGISIEKFVSEELRAADPFAEIEWRALSDATDFSDAASLIWLGALPLGVHHPHTLAINAHGWIALMQQSPSVELSLTAFDFDAAACAVVFAACLAAARVFSRAFSMEEDSRQLAVALDSGEVSTDSTVCSRWVAAGGGSLNPTPWNREMGEEPSLEHLLVVSAGGIGGNFCHILSHSNFRARAASVVEPDSFDISNLNRAIGVGLQMVGSHKVDFAANALRSGVENVTAVRSSYENWITPEISDQLRQPGSAVVVGVDQVRTRLSVGSEWPWMLLNGATSGTTLSAAIHFRQDFGCVGCWYGMNDASYAATRMRLACGAGVASETAPVILQQASYSFVSVAAAAHLVALLIRAAHQGEKWRDYAGTLRRMSLRSPQNAELRRIQVSERCLLLCSEDYLQGLLQREQRN